MCGGKKEHSGVPVFGIYSFMIPCATSGPCRYLNKIALPTPWKISDQIPVCVCVPSRVSQPYSLAVA